MWGINTMQSAGFRLSIVGISFALIGILVVESLRYVDKKNAAKIIVELKAVKELCDEHRAQVFNYLRATGFQLGLLVNFGHYPKLEYERIVLTQHTLNNF